MEERKIQFNRKSLDRRKAKSKRNIISLVVLLAILIFQNLPQTTRKLNRPSRKLQIHKTTTI